MTLTDARPAAPAKHADRSDRRVVARMAAIFAVVTLGFGVPAVWWAGQQTSDCTPTGFHTESDGRFVVEGC